MKVAHKTILITGAGSGMGREMTLELVRRGAKVIALDMHADALEETQQLAGVNTDQIEIQILDVTDIEAINNLAQSLVSTGTHIDGLINNAGIIQPFVKISELTIAQVEKVMNVNFYGPLYVIKAFLPTLLTRPEAHILNVSSMGAYAPVPGQVAYGASKAAVKLLTEGLRSELLGTRVGVTIAFPGAVATNITINSGLTLPTNIEEQSAKFKAMPAKDAAKIMINAFEKGKPRVTVGKDARTMDLLSRLNPVRAANLIYEQMKSLLN